ncbi:MAG: hypothetical protein U0R17_05710 [Acidimicrobiia bacterium]
MTYTPDLSEKAFQPRYALPERAKPPVLGFITDCTDDLALTKVELAKIDAFGDGWKLLPTIGIPKFQTDVLGVQGAVLARYLGEYSQKNEVQCALILNSAPRVQGEGLIGGEILVIELDNGVPVLLTNGPGVLEPFEGRIANAWKIHTDVMVQNETLQPTQFRSFKWFSDLLSKFLYADKDLVHTPIEDINTYFVPRENEGPFIWHIDNFGNAKLTITESYLEEHGIEEGDELVLQIAGKQIVATARQKLFPLPEDADKFHIGHYKGSDQNGDQHYWELAIAWESFAAFVENEAVSIDSDSTPTKLIPGAHVEVLGIRKSVDREERDYDEPNGVVSGLSVVTIASPAHRQHGTEKSDTTRAAPTLDDL